MKIHDIEIDEIKFSVNFIMEDGKRYENILINSSSLSNVTMTNIFYDLSKLNPKNLKEVA